MKSANFNKIAARKKPKAAVKKPGAARRRKGAGRPKGARDRLRRFTDFVDLGDAPADELERLRWMSAALGVRARQVMLDQRMSDAVRGGELRSLARTMNALVSKERLRRAEKAVRGEADAMKRPIGDPPVEAAPPRAPEDEDQVDE